MAGASSSSNPPRPRKRVEAETNSLKRARNGSAFTRCDECNKDVAVALIDMHNCSLDSKIRMNLEAVEMAGDVKKPAPRKRASASEPKEKKTKKERKVKDANAPKRPPTAFFLFMDEFRKEYKEAHPDNKSVSVVAKEGGKRWKSMSDEDKKVYSDRAVELKAEYEKVMETYNAEEAGAEEVHEDEEVKEYDGVVKEDEDVIEEDV